jgi:alkylation response protein AidB-like acyl-CoA dehydrogenase
MNVMSDEEQNLLRDAATRFFSERHPISKARRPIDWGDADTRNLWRDAAEMGFLGSAEHEADDSLGMVGAWIVQEAAGASLFQLPIAEAMAIWPVLARSAAPADREVARSVLSGSECGIVYWYEHREEPAYIDFVPGSAPAISIRSDTAADAYTYARVLPDTLVPLVGLEPGIRRAAVAGAGQELPLRIDLGDADFPHRWRMCLAAQAVGTGSRAFEMACAFAKEREQFGKPIGVHQSIKHRLANHWMALDNARVAGQHAANALDTGAADVRFAVDVAVLVALEAALSVTADAIQIHGAIGFSWEHDCHLFLKRALSLASKLGGEGRNLQRIADLVEPESAIA